MKFSDADVRQIEKEGLTKERVEAQIGLFNKGVNPLELVRPCTVGDGIEALAKDEISMMVDVYDEEVKSGREILKFVPASGAASRMFKDWYVYLEKGDLNKGEKEALARDLKRFAFYGDLTSVIARKGERIESMIAEGKYADILVYILTSRGLNYGSLPKALLKFHTYSGGSRTAIEEHLVEAAMYAKDACRTCRLHFTLSDEHNDDIAGYLSTVRGYYEKDYDVNFAIALSTQRPSTNTIAVDLDNHPFRDQNEELVFRPGGHGALLDNLNDACGDIVYLKNIDNVVPDRLKPITVLYKKVIGGYLISLQKEIFRYLELLEKSQPDEKTLHDVLLFCRKSLHLAIKPGFENLTQSEKRSSIVLLLNRPIRVCGMVKNEGEPGGGPFWVNA
ncbi:MAG TPA: DUF4301 family protein, partial [Syntrophales bacterium]|nr:DUF4301 family protein [Syntrophales bacterium]